MNDRHLPDPSSRSEIDRFLAKVKHNEIAQQTQPAGRLLFALDATASREPTWDHACHLQSQMFEVSDTLGGLAIQLCYYRSLGEFHTSNWHRSPQALLNEMNAVRCLAGHTQIERVLNHALATQPLNATVFIGDAMEEDAVRLRHLAGKLGLLGRPVFIFHEGHDAVTRAVFNDIARLSKGACCPFDINSPDQLRELLGAVAVYASGGHQALVEHCKKQQAQGQTRSQQLLQQLEGPASHPVNRDKT
jgi:hypothetical protein